VAVNDTQEASKGERQKGEKFNWREKEGDKKEIERERGTL
jgi:hypothetical protein